MPYRQDSMLIAEEKEDCERNAMYRLLFSEYPDVVTVEELCRMLGGIGRKSAYALVHDKKIGAVKVGRTYRIPKLNVIRYLELSI